MATTIGKIPIELDWSNLSGFLLARNDIDTQLSETYSRCFAVSSTEPRELILITGPAGVGKSSIALSLKDKVAEDNGFMISGKFEQLESNIPEATTKSYRPFSEALTQYIELIVAKKAESETEVQSINSALVDAMDSTEIQVIQEMIPELDKILDNNSHSVDNRLSSLQAGTSVLKGPDADDRLVRIFSLFVRTICSLGRNIVLFLDDLQWADQSALNLLASLLDYGDDSSTTTPRLMLLCTCRMNEVSEDHPLTCMLSELNDQKIVVTEIDVSNLTTKEVNQIISDVLRMPISDSVPLSDFLFQQTDGNLLFLIELIKFLVEDGILFHEKDQWTWKMDDVLVAGNHSSINRLIEQKVHGFDDRAQELLKIASCLGSFFSTKTLLHAQGLVTADEINDLVRSFERKGLVTLDSKTGTCRFVHDKVQQTIYQLIPASTIGIVHLNIGRELKNSLPRESLAEHVILVSHQISLGVHLIDNAIEKQQVAELFLQAGEQAASCSSFVTAAAFLNLAIKLLSRRRWKDQYKLSLRLHNFAAEVEYYNGNLARFDELVDAVLKHARCFDDTLVARFTRIYSLGSRGSMQEGLNESLDVLKSLGETFPRKPSYFNIVLGLMRCKRMLLGMTDDGISSLPTLTDTRKEAAMRLMIYSMLFAFYSPGHLLPLMAFRLVEITLTHGMSNMACVGFGCLGMVSAFRGSIDEAYRFSRLSLRLFDVHGAKEWQARVYGVVHGMISPLKHPFRDTVDPLYAAHRSSLVLGDIHFSMLCCAIHANRCFFAGFPLARVVKEAKRCRALCIKFGQRSAQSLLELYLQLVLNLMGESSNPLVLTGEVINEEEALRVSKEGNPVDYLHLHLAKLQLAVYMNDFPAAKTVLDLLKKLDCKKFLPYMIALLHFFTGLAYAMSSSYGDRKRARGHLSRLKVVAKHSPGNFISKVHLIEAELASRQAGKIDSAIAEFNLSIDRARQEGLLPDEALAHERAAYALERHHRPQEAIKYLADARALYNEWGAQVKVVKLAAER